VAHALVAGVRPPARPDRRLPGVHRIVPGGECHHARSLQLFRNPFHVLWRCHAGARCDGQTIVILTGGFDLSTGAVVSLVNVVLANTMGTSSLSQVAFFGVAVAVGALVGALNGFFVAFVRMQSIVVTLSAMFIVQGVTRLVMEKPGGTIAPGFAAFFSGDAIPNLLPAPLVVLLVAGLVWWLVKNSRLGVGLYALGSDEDAAHAAGIRTG
jgi:ribose transport system permease protein